MHKILVIRLYFQYTLYVFRTVLVRHQEQLYKLYIAFGICRYMLIRLAVYPLITNTTYSL